MSKEIIIKPGDIKLLAEEGGNFLFKPQAENELLKLIELKELIDKTLEEVKEKIAEAGLSVNPNFRGVIGEKLRCIYRAYGGKYRYDWQRKQICEPFLKRREYFSVDTDKVEAYEKEVGELPDGIMESDRENKLSIVFKDEERQLIE